MLRSIPWVLGTAVFMVAGSAHAADIKLAGVHNCCGGCNATIMKTLTDAGATAITVNKGDIAFTSAEPAKVVTALYTAGFAAKTPLPEGTRPTPSGARGVKGKEIKTTGIHNCCPACAKAINEVLAPVGKTAVKPKETAITVTADTEIEATAVVNALRGAGFNVTVVK